jgi:hypothetical protein
MEPINRGNGSRNAIDEAAGRGLEREVLSCPLLVVIVIVWEFKWLGGVVA